MRCPATTRAAVILPGCRRKLTSKFVNFCISFVDTAAVKPTASRLEWTFNVMHLKTDT